MKKVIFFIVIIFAPWNRINSQEKVKVESTCFTSKVRSNSDIVDIDAPRTFCVKREYFQDKSFTEYNLFGENKYKIKKNKWYINNGKNWSLFFSKRNFRKKNIVRVNTFYFVPEVELISERLYKYQVFLEDGSPAGVSVHFDLEYGIIELEYSPKYSLIRIKK